MWRQIRRELRSTFHWKYSGAFIPLFFATGVAMALASRFAMAYTFFILFGVWGIGYWLTSDFLRKKLAHMQKRETRRNRDRYNSELVRYRAWQLTVVVAVVLLTVGFMGWTRSIKNESVFASLKQQRDDAFDHLSVEPTDLPLGPGGQQEIELSVVDGGHADMDNHTVECLIWAFRWKNNVGLDRSMSTPEQQFAEGLLGSGRGETVECSTLIANGGNPPACIGIDVGVHFTVVGQPTAKMDKWYRFSYDYRRPRSWEQQSFQSTLDPCSI